MYQPPHFREDRLEAQHDLIRSHPFGLLVTHGAGGIEANPIPFLLDAQASCLGTLRGHLARANGQWRGFDPVEEALVVFQGPDGYVSPSWYETKRRTAQFVPTPNYKHVHERRLLSLVEDREWLLRLVEGLTSVHERGRPVPWAVSDAPAVFVEAQLKAIVGIELEIARIEGKWKLSQNRPEADRLGVAEGLKAEADPGAREMARLVEGADGPED